MKIKNLIGNRYGKLTVLYLCKKRGLNNCAIWHCKCDCGNETDISSRHLITGHTKSCGCLKEKNYIGKKFNHLIVLNKFTLNKNRYFECKCDCGNTCMKLANNVVRGTTKTCGCGIGLILNTPSKILKYDKYAYICISGIEKPAIIDIEDYDKVKSFHWWSNKHNYIYTRKSIHNKSIRIFLHRLIIPIYDKNLFIDHINGNTLDNRKCNLRIVNRQQNSWNRKTPKNNTTGYIGVYINRGKFVSCIRYNKKNIYLGSFNSLEKAVKVRKDAEIKYFGEYRRKTNANWQ